MRQETCIYFLVLVNRLCLTLCDTMDYSWPSSSIHGILQARILERIAVPFSRGSSQPREWTWVSHCRQILYHLSHRETLYFLGYLKPYWIKSLFSFFVPWFPYLQVWKSPISWVWTTFKEVPAEINVGLLFEFQVWCEIERNSSEVSPLLSKWAAGIHRLGSPFKSSKAPSAQLGTTDNLLLSFDPVWYLPAC